MKRLLVAVLSISTAVITASAADPATITVGVNKPGAKVSPTLWGIFFEDINCSIDGGIYSEQIRNRSFEDSTNQADHWSLLSSGPAKVELKIDTNNPVSPHNTNSLRFTATSLGLGRVGVVNQGFWGIALHKGEHYDLNFDARGDGKFRGPLTVSLESSDGMVYNKKTFSDLTTNWQALHFNFAGGQTDPHSRLVVSINKPGTFWLDMVSLFPEITWKSRTNGLRPDLINLLADLKPGFMRFPGGCWVEGERMATSYRWKETIGDTSERRNQYNLWRYFATHGVGFHEYLQLAEDLGAEPLFVINCGMSHQETVPMSDMGPYVQDALDAIEYCNGPVSSKWGSVRARSGHPAPFNLKYMEIGNENGGRAYEQRYALFYDAIKSNYPDMHLIGDVWHGVPTNHPLEYIDEHYYDTPEWFIKHSTNYDGYTRKTNIYIGEYAVTQGVGQGNLRAAVGEAAFMTGIERNSDVVRMASYAPLFVNVNQRSWSPDLIDYDNDRVYAIPSYYVQKMFSQNRGDVILPVKVESPMMPSDPLRGAVGVGTWRTSAEFKDFKVMHNGTNAYAWDPSAGTQGWRQHGGDWEVVDGAIRQNDERGDNIRIVVGDEKWTDYTFSLKARKISGAEGFLIVFGSRGDNTPWWNVAGWNNSEEALLLEGSSDKHGKLKIETNRWYDLRVELKANNIKCYMDDQLIREETIESSRPSLYASATRIVPDGDVIVKVVNAWTNSVEGSLKLDGVSSISGPVRVTELCSEKPTDENTLDTPGKVRPIDKTIKPDGATIPTVFPGNSVTVFRALAK